MTGYAYDTALEMIVAGHYVLCVPGVIDGELVVVTRGYKLPREGARYARHPVAQVRAAFAWGALGVARRDTAKAGVTL